MCSVTLSRHITAHARWATFAILTLFSINGTAQVDCTGKIEALGISRQSGIVSVDIAGGPYGAQLCSVNELSVLNDINPKVCRTLFSSLMEAKSKQQPMTIRFRQHNDCSAPDLQHQLTGPLIWHSKFERSSMGTN